MVDSPIIWACGEAACHSWECVAKEASNFMARKQKRARRGLRSFSPGLLPVTWKPSSRSHLSEVLPSPHCAILGIGPLPRGPGWGRRFRSKP